MRLFRTYCFDMLTLQVTDCTTHIQYLLSAHVIRLLNGTATQVTRTSPSSDFPYSYHFLCANYLSYWNANESKGLPMVFLRFVGPCLNLRTVVMSSMIWRWWPGRALLGGELHDLAPIAHEPSRMILS